MLCIYYFFFSSRRRHTRSKRDWSSDVCSSDLADWRKSDPGPLRPRSRPASARRILREIGAARGGAPRRTATEHRRIAVTRIGRQTGVEMHDLIDPTNLLAVVAGIAIAAAC